MKKQVYQLDCRRSGWLALWPLLLILLVAPTGSVRAQDVDGDGLSLADETRLGTDPAKPDTDDDGLTDKQEVDQGTDPLESLSPFVMRYIHNNGTGRIDIPGTTAADPTGERFNTPQGQWTIECAVRVDQVPAGDIILIQRKTQPAGYVTFELGIHPNRYAYARFQSDLGTVYEVQGYAPIETNAWIFLSGKYGVDERQTTTTKYQLSLFQNGTRTIRDVTSVLPVQGTTMGNVIVASSLAGDIDEIRIWNTGLPDDEVLGKQWKSLLYGQDVGRMGALSPNGGDMMRYAGSGDPKILTNWTIEAWIKTTGAGIIVAREGGVGADSATLYNYYIGVTPGGTLEAKMDLRYYVVVNSWPVPKITFDGQFVKERYGTLTLNGSTVVSDGQWHHVAFTFGPTNLVAGNITNAELYVDGILEYAKVWPLSTLDLNWHLLNGETVMEFWYPNGGTPHSNPPNGEADKQPGNFIIGDGMYGLIDEIRLYNRASTALQINNRLYTKASPTTGSGGSLVSYFDYDDITVSPFNGVPDSKNKVDQNLFVFLHDSAEVVMETGDNAPLKISPLTVLAPKLAAYFPLEDGRYNSGAFCIEDFTYRFDKHPADWSTYAASLMPGTANIDFALYSSTDVFHPANPFAGNEGPMAFPSYALFKMLPDCPWRMDSDGDGMPDIFEQYYSLEPNRAYTPNNPDMDSAGDLDDDGLSNLYEYYAGTDPTFHDSNNNGIDDGQEDNDGDGFSNGDEEILGTHPGRVDSDDDGFNDGEEVQLGSNPADSMDPKDYFNVGNLDPRYRFKSMVLDGNAYQIPSPPTDSRRFNSTDWTIECWVRVTNSSATGPLIQYKGTMYSNLVARNVTYWELGLTNGTPYVAFQSTAEFRMMRITNSPVVLNRWTHLAGVFDDVNNVLGLYWDGVLLSKLQVFESAMSGTDTAAHWPGKAYIGGRSGTSAGVLGTIDEVRIWSVARSDAELLEGMSSLVQVTEAGQICNFRFDDGRRITNAAAMLEAPDGPGLNDGKGAEDFVHRINPDDLETPLQYTLQGISFYYTNAVIRPPEAFDDADADELPDWWEGNKFNELFTSYIATRDAKWMVINSISRTFRVRGYEEPAFSAAYFGWGMDYTPITTIPGVRWTQSPDGGWMFKDIFLPAGYKWVEMRIALEPGADSIVYVNGIKLDLTLSGITAAEDTFDVPRAPDDPKPYYTVVKTYYIPYNVLADKLVEGRNRIAVQMVNSDGSAAIEGRDEFFNMELVVDGTDYLIRRGDDTDLVDRTQARWWVFANPGSMMEPPKDKLGNEWWEKDYAVDTEQDLDDDGLIDTEEYLVGSNPLASDTDGDGDPDRNEDFDGDGLSNADELFKNGTNPRLKDTDDDGYEDGVELNNMLPDPADNYGVRRMLTSPVYSLSPRIYRCLVMNGRSIEAPYGERFTLDERKIDETEKPVVTITSPTAGASSTVRYTTLSGTISSFSPIVSLALYNNNRFVQNISLTGGAYNETVIIGAGDNVLRIVATTESGVQTEQTVTVKGTFAAADIRVTQTWSVNGDLDTWLIDSLGRYKGWTDTGPGYPSDSGVEIPSAVLDIDDIPGDGPENITIVEGNAVAGAYEVWMNNFRNRGNPQSTVRILVAEGTPYEQYVEFGPHSMPTMDLNDNVAAAWWHVTTISWPTAAAGAGGGAGGGGATTNAAGGSGAGASAPVTFSPGGTVVSTYSSATEEGEITAEGPTLATASGWTIEAWVKPLNDIQSGAIASYQKANGEVLYAVGLLTNRPFMLLRSQADRWYKVQGGALRTNEWTHLAFVYGQSNKTVRLYVDGMLVVAQQMMEARLDMPGNMFIDAAYTPPGSAVASTFNACRVDELRFWSRARSKGLVASERHKIVGQSQSLIACYRFDDGGKGIDDGAYPLDRIYDLGTDTLPDVRTNEAPGLDGIWGTANDVFDAPGSDGCNDYVTAIDHAPVYGDVDADDDGLPNWWEITFYGKNNDAKPGLDDDSDGLNNLYEYLSGTNPFDEDSDADGVLDRDEDFDHDGLSNGQEEIKDSDPTLTDTDDDNLFDGLEVQTGKSPVSSISPATNRVLHVDGEPGSYLTMPKDHRYQLEDWEIAAWIYPEGIAGDARIIAYSIGQGVYNYYLGMDVNQHPVLRYTTPDFASNVTIVATNIIPMNTWTYLKGTYKSSSRYLSLEMGITPVASTTTVYQCAMNGIGPVHGVVGEEFVGMIELVSVQGSNVWLSGDDVADFNFDDGTDALGTSGVSGWGEGQVENFASDTETDWKDHWLNAANLVGGASIIGAPPGTPVGPPTTVTPPGGGTNEPPPPPPLLPDRDNDGLPDDWETEHGLSPTDPYGDNGPWGDPDHDGLINLYEYSGYRDFGVDLDPRNFISVASLGPDDYDSRPSSTNLTFGEIYDDSDMLPDGWEVKYPGLSRFYYNADEDPDGDGWSNLNEYTYTGTVAVSTGTIGTGTNTTNVIWITVGRGTDPSSYESHPFSTISGYVLYNGTGEGDYYVAALDGPTFGSRRLAVTTATLVDNKVAFTLTGSMQGDVYLFAFKSETDGIFIGKDPFGFSDQNPINMSWGDVTGVEIGISDQTQTPWYYPFCWTNDPALYRNWKYVPEHFVRLNNSRGQLIMTTWISSDVNGVLSTDYQNANWIGTSYALGLPPDNYYWNVAFSENGGVSDIFTNGSFSVTPTITSLPTIIYPSGGTIIKHGYEELRWRTDNPTAWFEVSIQPAGGAWTWTTNIPAPWRADDGSYKYPMPDLFGAGVFTNGMYQWRVQGHNAYTNYASGWSATAQFSVSLTDPPPVSDGAPAIGGNVTYYGKVTNRNVYVEAYGTPSFSGDAYGRTILTSTLSSTFKILGLYSKSYYVRAFIDVDRDGICDNWEPQGIYRDPAYGGAHYEYWTDYAVGKLDMWIVTYTNNVSIVIRDRDTDNDNMPDGWEYMYFGNLNQSGSGDYDGDGLSNLGEYAAGTSPVSVSTAGDGIPDGWKIQYGLNPLAAIPPTQDSDGDGLTDLQEYARGTNPTNPDTDSDGLPDGFEVTLGLNPTVFNSDVYGVPAGVKLGWDGNVLNNTSGDLSLITGDTDGDGFSDLEEIAAGSDPLNASSTRHVEILSLIRNALGFPALTWNTYSNRVSADVTFYVEISTNMVGTNWSLISTKVSNGDTNTTVTVTDVTRTPPPVFYRLRYQILPYAGMP